MVINDFGGVESDAVKLNIIDVFSNGLVRYWKFNETSGNIANDSVGNFNGTLKSSTNFVPGKFGNAIDLDSLDNSGVSFPTEAGNVGPNLTISVWVKWTGSNEAHTAQIFTNDQIHFRTAASGGGQAGSILLRTGSSNSSQLHNFSNVHNSWKDSENWHHVGATIDGNNGRLYGDGAMISIWQFINWSFSKFIKHNSGFWKCWQ